MVEKQRKPMIIGNWKMHKSGEESAAFVHALAPCIAQTTTSVMLAVPFTDIRVCCEAAKNTSIIIGAQNMHDASEGAYTGETSAAMLVDAGAKFVLLGHSERRTLFCETNAFIDRKVKRALLHRITPVVCVGESLDERDAGQTRQVLQKQIEETLAGLTAEQISGIVLAYEPVWAIGSGHAATPEAVQECHFFCRSILRSKWGVSADRTSILYGGSVKPDNAKAFMDQSDVDGLLVGSGSLSVDTFSKIVHFENSLHLSRVHS